jgi:hypothetical protein
MNPIDSALYLSVTFGVAGYVNFTFANEVSNTNSGLQFILDGALQQLPAAPTQTTHQTVQIPVTSGSHSLVWNYHQEAGTKGVVHLSNVILVGDVTGAQTLSQLPECPAGTFASSTSSLSCTPCAAGNFSANPGSSSCDVCPVNTTAAQAGQSSCESCGVGTFTNAAGSQECITNCVFSPFFPNSSASFDLTSLGTAQWLEDSVIYTINVCQQLSGGCANSYVCSETRDGVYSSLGSSIHIIPQNVDSLSPFSIRFDNGPASAQCPNGTASNIQFICFPNDDGGSPEFHSFTDCVYNFNWPNSAGCPVCVEDDYLTLRGVCSGGSRIISKTKQAYCNGPASIDVLSEDCSSSEFPNGAIIAIVVAFVVIVAIAGFVFWRNRRLSVQYSQLRAQADSSQSFGANDRL